MSGPWERYAPTFDRAAALAETDKALNLPAGFSAAQIQVESGGKANARSPAGAMGLAQVMPATLASLSKRFGRELNPDDEKDAVDIHREVMRENLEKFKDPAKALMAYNGGWDPAKWGNPETSAYVGKVQAAMKGQQNPIMAAAGKAVNAVMPSAQAAESGKPWERYAAPTSASAPTSQPAPAESNGFMQGMGNVLAGAVRGAGSIGATILSPIDAAARAVNGGKPLSVGGYDVIGQDRRAGMDAGLQSMGAESDSYMFKGGKIAGEIAGTAGAGGVVAQGIGRVAPAAVAASPRVAQALEAIRSGGFNLGGAAGVGLAGRAADLGVRAAGGAASGAAQAGMVDPREMGMGALVGGALPVGVQGVGAIAGGLGNIVNQIKRPAETRLASKLAQSLGMTPDELAAAVTRQGPSMMPGYQETVPQILQNPVTSQLQRTLKTAGSDALGNAERIQQSQMRGALERVAPIDLTTQDAAARAGSAIQKYAIPAREQTTKDVSALFKSVDPFKESGIHLPISEMEAASAEFLGPGTFGTGSKAATALSTAREVGTQEIPAVQAITQKTASQGQNLEQAVRSAGGLRGNSGELRDLGIRQSGTTGLINNKSGQSADLLAEEMQRRGFLADSDPATLYEALRNSAGRKVFAADADASFARQFEGAMGDLPGAQTISKPVSYQTMQNLRSSIGEAAQQAEAKGANKESAALKQMVKDIDTKLGALADGKAGAGEFFDQQMADTYRQALAAHTAKMAKFETGPQIGMFRKGGDGQASIQGAEIPGKFFSGRRSQVEDVQSLKRLIGDQPALMDEMKRYAVTEGAGTSNVAGDLTSKFSKWLETRSGANAELFTKQENATLKEVGKSVEKSIAAENLGRVSGSDTAQKLEGLKRLDVLDSKIVNILANRFPYVKSLTGPILDKLRETAANTRDNSLAMLLASPEKLAEALKPGNPQSSKLIDLINRTSRVGSKAAPVIAAQ